MRKLIIGVMGPSDASESATKQARELGRLIAKEGWLLLSGGMASGVMDAANRGAHEERGTTIGILPTDDSSLWSKEIDIPIVTKMGSGRNFINALSSEVLVAVGMSAGTSTEVAFAIQLGKPVILMENSEENEAFFRKMGKKVYASKTAKETVNLIKKLLG